LAQAWRARTYWGEELELTEFPRFLRTPNVKTRDLQIVVHQTRNKELPAAHF